MNTPKNIIIIAIVALSAIIAFYIHESHNRYVIINASPGIAYEIDKKTGLTWKIQGNKKTEQLDPKTSIEKAKNLPENERSKITGSGAVSKFSKGFHGRVYNGSGWTLYSFEVVIECLTPDQLKAKYGKEQMAGYLAASSLPFKWTRRFRITQEIPPFTEMEFTCANGIQIHPFNESPEFCADVSWSFGDLMGWAD